jgi:hypothetical protein
MVLRRNPVTGFRKSRSHADYMRRLLTLEAGMALTIQVLSIAGITV